MRTAERRSKPSRRGAGPAGGIAVRIAGRVDIPASVRDHESFRQWARSPDCPEKLRVAFYNNAVWVDLDMEQFYIHNQVKAEIAATLVPLVKAAQLGRFAVEGMLLSVPEVGLTTIPDGYFISYEAFRAGRVRQVAGADSGCVELEGGPDMALEVVSKSSEQKDLTDLPGLYWQAGVREYWVVDVRSAAVRFDLLRRGPAAFAPARRQSGGWLKSEVFRRSFRLTQGTDPLGEPLYTLEVK